MMKKPLTLLISLFLCSCGEPTNSKFPSEYSSFANAFNDHHPSGFYFSKGWYQLTYVNEYTQFITENEEHYHTYYTSKIIGDFSFDNNCNELSGKVNSFSEIKSKVVSNSPGERNYFYTKENYSYDGNNFLYSKDETFIDNLEDTNKKGSSFSQGTDSLKEVYFSFPIYDYYNDLDSYMKYQIDGKRLLLSNEYQNGTIKRTSSYEFNDNFDVIKCINDVQIFNYDCTTNQLLSYSNQTYIFQPTNSISISVSKEFQNVYEKDYFCLDA